MDFDNIPICGTVAADFGVSAKWPGTNPRLTCYLNAAGYRGSLGADALRAAWAMAWAEWAKVIVIDPVMVQQFSGAMVRAEFARIDGSSGVLAWSHLANNTNGPKDQRYDSGEAWVITPLGATPPSNGIDLLRVMMHEIGHMIGLPHGPSGSLLQPMYSRSVGEVTKVDADRAVALGYARRTAPPAPPPPPNVPPPPVDPDPPPVGPPTVPPPALETVITDVTRRIVSVPANWTTVRH